MTDDERTPDRFEIALRRWAAEESLVNVAREAAQLYDLDPAVVEAVEDACREDDFDSIIEALTDFLRAVGEARGLL